MNDNNVQKLVRDFLSGKSSLTPLYGVLGLPEGEMSQNGKTSLAVPCDLQPEKKVYNSPETPAWSAYRDLQRLIGSEKVLYERGDSRQSPSGNWILPPGEEGKRSNSFEEEECNGCNRGASECVEELQNASVDKSFFEPSQARRHFVPAVKWCHWCGEEQDSFNDCCLCRCGRVMLAGPSLDVVRWLPRSRARRRRRVSRSPKCIPLTEIVGSVSNDGAGQRWYGTMESQNGDNDVKSELRSDVPVSRLLKFTST